MTRVPARVPRQVARLDSGEAAAPRPRVMRARKKSVRAVIAKELDKWLRKKPKRTAYWTGVLHGVIGVLLVVGASFVVSMLGTILMVVVGVLGVAWVVGRRG